LRDVAKQDLYRELGFGGPAQPFDIALSEAGLSGLRKERIAEAKRESVRAALEERFLRVCSRGECASASAADTSGRRPVEAASQDSCELCRGSVNAAAVNEMVEAMRAAGARRLCVVGGSPNSRREVDGLVAGRVELRLVAGDIARTRREAEGDIEWADRTVIWGGTQLSHKVSELYEGRGVIQMNGRGVARLAREVTRSLRRR
jgi:hypothetical protein